MSLPISLNPCEDLNAYVDAKTHSLEQAGVKLKSYINIFRNKAKAYLQPPSIQSAIDDAIALASVNDINAGTTAITQITNFSGTCLDPLYNGIRSFSLDIDGQITDKIDDITSFIALPEINLLKPLRAVTTALGGAQLENIITELDEKLNCLSAQGSELGVCLSMLDNFNDRIADVLSYLGLGDNGAWDLDTFISNFDIDINADVLNNLKSLNTKMDTLTTEAIANVKKVLPENVLPAGYR